MMDIYNRRISVQWVCGVIFFVSALLNIILYLKGISYVSDTPYEFVGYLVMLIVSIPIMINSKIKASLAASLMSITMGLAFIFVYYQETLVQNDELVYIFDILMMGVGVFMSVFGLGLLLGFKYNSERLKFTMIIGLAVIIIPILFEIRYDPSFSNIFKTIRDQIAMLLFFGMMLLVLNSPEIRFYTAYNRLLKNVIYIREVFSVAKDSWMDRNDFKRFVNYENEEWTPVGGPIIEEQTYIVHIYKATLRMIVSRWDNGTYRLKIAQNRSDVVIDKINMQITEIVPDGDIETCESFTVFGTDGIFIRLLVKDDKKTIKARKKAEKMMKKIDPDFESGDE